MWSDNETTEDLLGFKVHADLITEVVKDDSLLPITIGVFGDWGSGKSSILQIIREQLNILDDGTFVLYFNGWLFEGYDDAKAALLESIVNAFDENEKFVPKVKEKAKKLLKSVNWMRVLGFGFKNVALPIATAYATGGASLIPLLAQKLSTIDSSEIIEKLKGENPEEYLKSFIKEDDLTEKSMLVREFRDGFTELISVSKIKKLVVIIDDLDRCTPDRIIENLEAIKLFLNVEKTAFIIGADPRIVRHAIEYRFQSKNKEDGNDRIVDDYLEKLIQVPYNLPKLSDSEVETYISLLIAKRELSKESFQIVVNSFHEYRSNNRYNAFGLSNLKDKLSQDEFANLAIKLSSMPALSPVITQSLYGNPRQIKRFLNTFTLRKRLADLAKISGFNDAVLAKLMILEYAELPLFKQLYDWQSIQDGLPAQLKEIEDFCEEGTLSEIKEKIEKKSYQNWSKEKVIKWLTVEPRLSNSDLRDYFWLSRDKITSSISGSSLIPPIVKELFKKINQDKLPTKVSKQIICTEIKPLNDIELNQFLLFSSSVLKKNIDQKRLYDIFHYLIEEKIDGAELVYQDTLKSISAKSISPVIGSNLKRLDVSQTLRGFLNLYFKDNQFPASKAYNL